MGFIPNFCSEMRPVLPLSLDVIDNDVASVDHRLAAREHRALANVAVARKLATRLYLMLREDWTYA